MHDFYLASSSILRLSLLERLKEAGGESPFHSKGSYNSQLLKADFVLDIL